MKTILKVCTLFTFFFGTLFAQDPVIDSTTAGRAFARNMWDRYQIYGDFYVGNTWKQINATMDLKGRITMFQVDGVTIVSDDDTPLPGLPYVADGVITRFWLSIDAMAGDKQVAWGYTYVARLLEGQSLVVTLRPEDERGFVEYEDTSNSTDRPLLVNDRGEEIGFYDVFNQGFHYYLDPLNGPISAYVVINNRRVTSIWLEPFIPAKTMDNNVVNVELIGGVSRVLMNEYGYYSQTSVTDGQTERGGAMVPAKVFLLDTEGQDHQITIRTENDIMVSTEIYDVDNNRIELLADVNSRSVGYGVTYWEAQIPQGYGKILIVITSQDKTSKPFRGFFSKGFGPKG